jgi:cold-inducible RNA-binding protein
MNIYVGNLPWTTTDDELKSEFESYGQVDSATIIKDRMTNRSRGFGFVEMSDDTEAQSAIDGLNGKEIDGRALTVNKARPKPDRDSRDRRHRN